MYITSDGNIKLKHSHMYYAQVQLHMELTNTQYCDFFECTSVDFHKERINYDNEFWKKISLSFFFFQNCIAPEILTGKLKTKFENKLFIKSLLDSLIDQLFLSFISVVVKTNQRNSDTNIFSVPKTIKNNAIL